MKTKFIDERTERINGLVSFYFLMLTQIALAGVIFYKRYVLGQMVSEYLELVLIIVFSMGGYWAVRLYLSGILPVISFNKLLVIYFISVSIIVIPTYIIHGMPPLEQWYEVLYPFIGVAVILGVYSLVAFLGKRRLEKNM